MATVAQLIADLSRMNPEDEVEVIIYGNYSTHHIAIVDLWVDPRFSANSVAVSPMKGITRLSIHLPDKMYTGFRKR